MMIRFPLMTGILFISSFTVARAAVVSPDSLVFELTFDSALRSEPFSGRVMIYFTDRQGDILTSSLVNTGPRWGSAEPIFSTVVKNWKPGQPLRVDNPTGFPYELRNLPAKTYAIRAVMQPNRDRLHVAGTPGNLSSKWIVRNLDPTHGSVLKLMLDHRVEDKRRMMAKRRVSDRAVEIKLRSERLSQFHGRDIFLQAWVLPPAGYEDHPQRHYPAIYAIPGFGGDHYDALRYMRVLGSSPVAFFRVGLDATCPLGHHVFADSDNDGPWGQALTNEFIPYLEKRYRLIPESRGRFLVGHSSGGWSSLWLQISYPDIFGGVWSGSPDPVDFHDFCGINLYDPKANFYFDHNRTLRPLIRTRRRTDKRTTLKADSPITPQNAKAFAQSMKGFARQEMVAGPGGQLLSFEAVFGQREEDGLPARLYNRQTGKIDQRVVQSWRRYDIVDKLQREWTTLGPKLAGKITVIMGGQDTFYLEGATRRLKQALKQLGSDARIIIVPNKDHITITRTQPYRNILREMGDQFQATEPTAAIP